MDVRVLFYTSLLQNKGNEPLKSIRREIIIIHESLAVPDLFKLFLEKREHIALVVDEFGGMAGIITMEDVLETLLGTKSATSFSLFTRF